MVSTIKHRYTLDEYRALEEKAEGRNEYRDGEQKGIQALCNYVLLYFMLLRFACAYSNFGKIEYELAYYPPNYLVQF